MFEIILSPPRRTEEHETVAEAADALRRHILQGVSRRDRGREREIIVHWIGDAPAGQRRPRTQLARLEFFAPVPDDRDRAQAAALAEVPSVSGRLRPARKEESDR